MESKKNPSLQKYLIDPPPPYASAQILERFLEEAQKWPKKMLADPHVRRVLEDTRQNLEWARKNPITGEEKSARDTNEKDRRIADSGLFQRKTK